MDSNFAEPAESRERPKKETNKDVAKLKAKPKKSPNNLALTPKKNRSKLSSSPHNLALEPQKNKSSPSKKFINLALGPEKEPCTPNKELRDLALGPDKISLKSPINLALGPQDKGSKPLKKPLNLALGPDREISDQKKNQIPVVEIEQDLNKNIENRELKSSSRDTTDDMGRLEDNFREKNSISVLSFKERLVKDGEGLRLELERILDKVSKLEDLNIDIINEFKTNKDYTDLYGITNVRKIVRETVLAKYEDKNVGILILEKIKRFRTIKAYYSREGNDFNKYIKIYKEYKMNLPKDPYKIFNKEIFSNLKTYSYYKDTYGVTRGAVRNCLKQVLADKYCKEFDFPESFVNNLHKKFGKKFQERGKSERGAKAKVTIGKFLKIVNKLGSLEYTVDEILSRTKDVSHAEARSRQSFDRYLRLLRLLKDHGRFKSMDQLNKYVVDQLKIHETTAREYVSLITASLDDYRSLTKDLKYKSQRWTHLETLEEFAIYLKDEIMKNAALLKKIENKIGVRLPKGYAPSVSWLISFEYSGFLSAIYSEKGFDYFDVVKKACLKYPNDNQDLRVLGKQEHSIDERWILQFLRECWDCNTYFETKSIYNKVKYNGHLPDLSVVIGDGDVSKGYSEKLIRFRKYLFEAQKEVEFTEEMRENIHQFNIDFFHGTEFDYLVDKALRRFQGKHRLSIIVLTSTAESGNFYRDQLLKDDRVKGLKYKNNIFVLNKEEFANFISLRKNMKNKNEESYYTKFVEGSELFNDAYWDFHIADKLSKISDENKDFLKNQFFENFGENDGSKDGWIEYITAIGLIEELVKDNPYPYDQIEEEREKNIRYDSIDNFLEDK